MLLLVVLAVDGGAPVIPMAPVFSVDKAEARRLTDRIFGPPQPFRPASPQELKRMFGAPGVARLTTTARAEAYLIVSEWKPKHAEDRVAGYRVRGGPVALSEVQARELAAEVLRRDASDDLGNKFCGGFRPGAAVRFFGAEGEPPFDVALCFGCGDFGVWRGELDNPRVASSLNTINMGKSQGVARRMLGELFPGESFREPLPGDANGGLGSGLRRDAGTPPR
jgi:hypothetical protein